MAKHERRTPEQLIRDLETRIAGIRARAERKEAKQNPAIRNALLAVKAIDKALTSDPDAGLKLALQEARTAIAEGIGVKGAVRPAPAADAPRAPKGRRQAKAVSA